MSGMFISVIDSIQSLNASGLFTQKRIDRISVLDAFGAKKVDGGLEALLIQVDVDLMARIEEWPQSEGFQVVLRSFDKAKDKTHICLELSSDKYRDVFRCLGEDVCSVMAGASDAREAVLDLHRRLYRWQAFLKKHKPEGLSEEARVGLFGELLVLRDLYLAELDPVLAVSGWRGCKKAHQDFQHPGLALEVKTNRQTIPDKVYISNIQQLDEDGIDRMFLTVVWVHQNDTAGDTLPEMVSGLMGLLPDPAGSMLRDGLMEVGYLEAQAELYAKDRYQLREFMHFEVQGDFPRMTRDQVPEGVKGVKYQISLDACREFKVEPAVVSSAVGNISTEATDD